MPKRKKKKSKKNDIKPAIAEKQTVQESPAAASEQDIEENIQEHPLSEYGIAELDFEYSEDGRKTYASYEPFIYVTEDREPLPETVEAPLEEPAKESETPVKVYDTYEPFIYESGEPAWFAEPYEEPEPADVTEPYEEPIAEPEPYEEPEPIVEPEPIAEPALPDISDYVAELPRVEAIRLAFEEPEVPFPIAPAPEPEEPEPTPEPEPAPEPEPEPTQESPAEPEPFAEPEAPAADPEEDEYEETATDPGQRRKRRIAAVLTALVILGGVIGMYWTMNQPREMTMSEAFDGRDREIWYHVSSENGEFKGSSKVVSAWVFEDGYVTWYRAPEDMTLRDVARTKEAKIYNALRKENIIRFKEINEENRAEAEEILADWEKYDKAKKKAEDAEKAKKKEQKALEDQYKLYGMQVPEEMLKALDEKYKTEEPEEPAVSREDAERAQAFLEAFEDGEETPEGCSWELYRRDRDGEERAWLAFNTEEYPQFTEAGWREYPVESNYLCLYSGPEVLTVAGHTVGGYRIGDETGATGTDLLLTPCKTTSVYLLDADPSERVSFNKGDETIRVEMDAAAEQDRLRILGSAEAVPETAAEIARKTVSDAMIRMNTRKPDAPLEPMTGEEITDGE